MMNLFKLFKVKEIESDLFDDESFMLEAERPPYIPMAIKKKRNGQARDVAVDKYSERELELKNVPSIFETR